MEGHLVCSATQIIGLLAFVYLFYTQSFGFDPNKLYFGTRDLVKNTTMEEVYGLKDNLQPLFKSFIGDGDQQKLKTTGFACDSTFYSLVCVASNRVKIDTKTMEIYMPTRFNSTNDTNTLDKEEKKVVQVKPYPWSQIDLLKTVTPVKFLQQSPQTPARCCNYNHTVPVVIFSSGGFAGNLFHEFNEIIIPLYITSRVFKSQVQFILVDYNPSMVKKYERIFSSLSRYNVLNPMMNARVHCFPGAVVGLKFQGFLGINSSEVPRGNSMIEFKKFLGIAYGLKSKNMTNTGKVCLYT